MLISQATTDQIFERARRMLGGPPARIQAAALPWRESGKGIEMLMITSRDTGRWLLPKGWPEENEALHRSAEREAWEEAGIRGIVSDNAIGSYFYGKASPTGLIRRCEVFVYPLKVLETEKRWPERGERDRRWLPPQDAVGRVAEPGLAEMIAGFADNPRESAA